MKREAIIGTILGIILGFFGLLCFAYYLDRRRVKIK